jgi:hypothetical protein
LNPDRDCHEKKKKKQAAFFRTGLVEIILPVSVEGLGSWCFCLVEIILSRISETKKTGMLQKSKRTQTNRQLFKRATTDSNGCPIGPFQF